MSQLVKLAASLLRRGAKVHVLTVNIASWSTLPGVNVSSERLVYLRFGVSQEEESFSSAAAAAQQ